MPRAGWFKPVSDRRLSDLVSVGLLTKVFPPDLVDEVIATERRTEQRHRSLPARVVAYFVIAMAPSSTTTAPTTTCWLNSPTDWVGPRGGKRLSRCPQNRPSSRRGSVSGRRRSRPCFAASPDPSPRRRPKVRFSVEGVWSPSTAPAWTSPTRPRTRRSFTDPA
jgi:hypothetical protein